MTTLKTARLRAKKTLKEAAMDIGIGISTLHDAERSAAPSPALLIRAAEAYNDTSLLVSHCEACPIRQAALLRVFPDLDNVRKDPAIIVARIRQEMAEALKQLDRLAEDMSTLDFSTRESYRKTWAGKLDQLMDVERGIEMLKHELVNQGMHTIAEIKSAEAANQAKCEARGYCRKTGTEG